MNDLHRRPISESYWVEPGRFLAGEYPGEYTPESTRSRIDAMLEAGFNTFIDLTKPNETIPYLSTLLEQAKYYDIDVQHHHFPIGDFGLPKAEQMMKILDTLDRSMGAERKIYLHCWGGIGRTGTTVGCYLVRHGRTGKEALHQLAEWWNTVPKSRIHVHSPETRAQAEFILEWHKYENNPDVTE